MRVALVLDAVEFAGAERYLEVLAAGLLDAGDTLLVVLPAEADPVLAERLGVRADIEPVRGLRRIPSPGSVRRVRAAVRRFAPDVVQLNLTDQGDGIGPLLAAPIQRTVATLHNVLPARRPARERLSAALLRRVPAVLCVSTPVGAYVRDLGGQAIVVPNGLAPTPLHPEPRAALGLPLQGHIVGGIGRLHDQKGWDVLAAAARMLPPDTTVAVLGEGTRRTDLTGTGLQLLGARPDAAALVRAFDVLAVPSRYESFGFVALEAMHAGVPVVASRVGGLAELVADTGVLVPPEDAAALATALTALLADPDRRRELGAAGQARARANYTPQAMVSASRRVLTRIAARS